MGAYNNNIEEFYNTPNFDNILGLVKRSYSELKKNPDFKGKSLRDAFSNMLESIYEKYSSFESFKGVFNSVSDFKSKISKSLRKNKGNKNLPRGNEVYLYQNEVLKRELEEEKILKLLNREEY